MIIVEKIPELKMKISVPTFITKSFTTWEGE